MDDNTRLPPNDFEAEQALLGCLLVAPDCYANVSAVIASGDFYRAAHAEIYRAIESLARVHAPIDTVTVSGWLKEHESLDAVGGRHYVMDVSLSAFTPAHALYYARTIQTLSRARKTLKLMHELQNRVYEQATNVDAVLNDAQLQCRKLAASTDVDVTTSAAVSVDVLETIEVRCEHPGVLTNVPTGYAPVDNIMGGLADGRLIIFGGRSGMGKSTFTIDMIKTLITHYRLPCAMFSLEMSKEEVTEKLLCSIAGIDSQQAMRGLLTTEQWQELHRAQETLAEAAPFFISDSITSVADMRIALLALDAKGQLPAFVTLDHIHILSSANDERNRQVELGRITRDLKMLAREINRPIFALCQLSRELLKRGNTPEAKRPHVGDLRESGNIEENADQVMFIHRPEVFEKEEECTRRGDVEIIIGKNRFGPTGIAQLKWRPGSGSFWWAGTDGPPEYLRLTKEVPREVEVQLIPDVAPYIIDNSNGTRVYRNHSGSVSKKVWSVDQCLERIEKLSHETQEKQDAFWVKLENQAEQLPDDLHRAWWQECLINMHIAKAQSNVSFDIFDVY